MNARRWLLLTASSVLLTAGACATVAWIIDPYGLLRDPTGRKLGIYFAERKAKLLMSKRYVPANFDGLIIGPSSSANWDIDRLGDVRMYNESLDGANAAEEQLVVNQALARGRYRLAIFILHPILTSNHDVKEGLDHTRATESLGSIHLFVNELAHVLLAAHVRFGTSDAAPDGQLIFSTPRNLQPVPFTSEVLRIDLVALAQYRDLIRSFQSRGTRIVYVIPPIYEPCYALDRQALTAYLQEVAPKLPPAQIIDFNVPEYDSFRSSAEYFIDCVHLEPQGAARVAEFLKSAITNANIEPAATDLLRRPDIKAETKMATRAAHN
jgi:hypothetical protein